MVIIELTYKKALSEVDKYLSLHREFLDKYYATGFFVASGPKQPREGGVIIATVTKVKAEKIIVEDPFYQHRIADYRIVEFDANRGLKFDNIKRDIISNNA
ncbi:MAG: YciI family protein [Coxiellaceae bacterium]|nr:YciI family protein [Coxiellaceae bacterium]